MENRKGSGIFLGVVSIATLVVAIIGATFAFFSATVTSENTVDVTAYEFNASLSISPVYTGDDIIPLDPDGAVTGYTGQAGNSTNLLYAINEATNRCVDSQGHQVCVVYSATFTNNGSDQIKLNGKLITTANTAASDEVDENDEPIRTGFTNLKLVQLGGNFVADGVNTFTADLTSPIAVPSSVDGEVALSQVTVDAGDSETIYFVVYLDEVGAPNNKEMGASYTGQLTYTAEGGAQELTGKFDLTTQGA